MTRKKKSWVKEHLNHYCNLPGHSTPNSRREFLSAGLLAAASRLVLPSLGSLVARSAWANEISCENKIAELPPFINLQLAGGPALFANHLAHGRGGRALDNYAKLGVGATPNIENYFSNNAPFYAPDNSRRGAGFIEGMKSRMGASLFNEIIGGSSTGSPGRTVFVSVACMSIDDRFTNKHNLSGLIEQVGNNPNNLLPHILCEAGGENVTADVGKGINRFTQAYFTAPAYLRATNADSLESSLQFKGALTQLTPQQNAQQMINAQKQLIEVIHGLNKSKVEAILRDPASSQAQKAAYEVAYCASLKNLQNSQKTSEYQFDIYQNQNLARIWQKNFSNASGSFTGEFKNGVTEQIGYSVSATLSGFSPACTAVIGGYDYHLNQLTTRAGQHAHDIFFGETVANILMTAHHYQVPVFLYVSSDGSVSSPADVNSSAELAWQGDFGERGMNYIIAYHPSENIKTRSYSLGNYEDSSFQLNHFNNELVVDLQNPIAKEDAQELAAAAVFLNFLEFAGKKSVIDQDNMIAVKTALQNAASSFGEKDIFKLFSRIQKG